MGRLSNLKKNWRLMRISKRIGKAYSTEDLSALVSSRPPLEAVAAERDLFELVLTDPDTSAILDYHGATREDIEEIYRRLSAMGLGRWMRGSYVSAAAITVKPTLIYLLEATKAAATDADSEKSRWIKIVADLTSYFQSGNLGAVPH